MILCPSMMCASYANLEEEVRALEEAGTDIFPVSYTHLRAHET